MQSIFAKDSVSDILPMIPAYLTSNQSDLAMAEEFTTAQYSLTSNEMKTWFLFLSGIQSINQVEGTLFEFDAVGFADRLGIDARKARGKMVADLFVRLSKHAIDIRSREDENGEQNILHVNFISSVQYSKITHLLRIEIPSQLQPFIYALRKGTFISFDIETILELNTVAAMRIFFLLKNLERKGIHQITVEEFRKSINISPMSDYRTFKRDVIKKAVAEIHKHTEFKEFYIEDDGARGRKATTIFFGFSADMSDEDRIELMNVSHAMYKELKQKFSPRVLSILGIAIEHGFNPKYIQSQFDNFDDDRIVANITLVIDRIRKDKEIGKAKTPDEYGRYFIPAVINDWADKSAHKDDYLKKGDRRIKNQNLQLRMKDIVYREDLQNKAGDSFDRSKEYVNSMSIQELALFIRKNKKSLDALAGNKKFDKDKALSRKKTYREYRLICQIVAGKMISGEIA